MNYKNPVDVAKLYYSSRYYQNSALICKLCEDIAELNGWDLNGYIEDIKNKERKAAEERRKQEEKQKEEEKKKQRENFYKKYGRYPEQGSSPTGKLMLSQILCDIYHIHNHLSRRSFRNEIKKGHVYVGKDSSKLCKITEDREFTGIITVKHKNRDPSVMTVVV